MKIAAARLLLASTLMTAFMFAAGTPANTLSALGTRRQPSLVRYHASSGEVSPKPPSAAKADTQGPLPSAARWFKGNTHTHTINSDGDSTPDEVVRWYREHGYHFLVLTDHNYLTSVDGLNAVHGAADQFLVVRGEEVTSRSQDQKPVHVNGLDVQETVAPPPAGVVRDMLQQSVDGIRKARGIPNINHPNYGWAITADDLRLLERTRLLEIYNGHPQVNNLGGGGAPGLEDMWDRVLSSGRLMYGLAVDDAHYFKRPGDDSVPGPGRGWIYVRAPRLETRALVDAIERGDFYSSTGVELSNYEATDRTVALDVKADAWSKYRVQFIGKDGRVLDEQTRLPAKYTVRGDEGYVRARVLESNGRQAWTQPVPAGSNGPR
jgi:hypothetical protein